MAIDQRDVSSTLRFMKDDVLRQYAAMHKNDPYIFPLAFQESQNRQKLRMSQQTAQGMQPQPKVNDQALAQMAPPQAQPMPQRQGQGIANLSAPNMETMADGGIAGYEGYDEGSSDFGQGPVVMMAGGGHVPRYQGNPVDGSVVRARGPYAGVAGDIPGYMPSATPFMPQAGAPEELPFLQRQMAAAREEQRLRMLSMARERVARGQGTEADREALAAEQRKADASAPPTRRSDYEPVQDTAAPAAPKTNVVAAPKVDPSRRAKPTPEAVRKEPAETSGGIAELDPNKLFATALAGASKDERPEKGMLETFNADRKKAAEAELESEKSLNQQFADAFKGRRDRLDTREAAIGKMKDQSLGLALLQAGASIMRTRGNIGQAIGAGIDTGSKQYIAGLDKINSAKDKLADARDRLDDLQLNRDEMSARAIMKAENKIRDTALSGQENMIKFVMDRDKVNRETAMKIVDNQIRVGVSQAEISSRERISREDNVAQNARSAAQVAATLNTPDRILFDQLLKKNDNDATKALEAFKQAKGDKFDVRTSYADYLKAFAGKDGLAPPMSMAAYAGQFGATLPR